jgi:hypothetical protein
MDISPREVSKGVWTSVYELECSKGTLLSEIISGRALTFDMEL